MPGCCLYKYSSISGGTNALPSEFPHQVHLGYKSHPKVATKWDCGGSLVSADYVLTGKQIKS